MNRKVWMTGLAMFRDKYHLQKAPEQHVISAAKSSLRDGSCAWEGALSS
jgi:hypothetical protein